MSSYLTELVTTLYKTSNIIINVNRDPISLEHTRILLSAWGFVKKLVNRAHRNVCGNSTFADMRNLLLRKCLWTEGVQHCLSRVVSSCSSCKASSTPPPNRCVSYLSLNHLLHEVGCVDQFHLDGVKLFHAMATANRYSAVFIVQSTNLAEAVLKFKSCALSQFWHPATVHADAASCKGEFAGLMKI